VNTVQNQAADYSDGFEVCVSTPWIRVSGTELNSGAPIYAPGTAVTIPWVSYGVTGNVSVYIYDYTGTASGTLLQANIPVANGSWTWNIPAGYLVGGMYKFRLYQSTSVQDYNDVYFGVGTGTTSVTMVTPNGGEVWTRGGTYTVTVNTNAFAGLLSVYMYNYSLNGAGETIAASTLKPTHTGTSTMTWTIPAGHLTGTKWKMRVVNGSGSVSDFSNNYFTIN